MPPAGSSGRPPASPSSVSVPSNESTNPTIPEIFFKFLSSPDLFTEMAEAFPDVFDMSIDSLSDSDDETLIPKRRPSEARPPYFEWHRFTGSKREANQP